MLGLSSVAARADFHATARGCYSFEAGRERPVRPVKAPWRSWLARRPVTAEVAGSSPVGVA